MNDGPSYSVVLAGDRFVDVHHIGLGLLLLLLRWVSDICVGVDDVLSSDIVGSQHLQFVLLVAFGNHDESDQYDS